MTENVKPKSRICPLHLADLHFTAQGFGAIAVRAQLNDSTQKCAAALVQAPFCQSNFQAAHIYLRPNLCLPRAQNLGFVGHRQIASCTASQIAHAVQHNMGIA